MTANLTAVILAGGESTRFGSDKASALLRGEPLLQWVTRAVSLAGEVIHVRAAGQQLPPVAETVRVVEDEYDRLGPLAGMVTGLQAASHPWVFVTSCDAPLLQPGLLPFVERLSGGFDIVLPVAGGHPQPLLALYRRESCLPVFRAAVESGQLKITAAFEKLSVQPVDDAMLRIIDPELLSLRSCNTPEALAAVEALLASRSAA